MERKRVGPQRRTDVGYGRGWVSKEEERDIASEVDGIEGLDVALDAETHVELHEVHKRQDVQK